MGDGAGTVTSMVDVQTPVLDPVERKYFIKFMEFDEDFVCKARTHIQHNLPLDEPTDAHDLVKKSFGVSIVKHDSVPTAIKWLSFAATFKQYVQDAEFKKHLIEEHRIPDDKIDKYYEDKELTPVPSSFLKSLCYRNINFKVGTIVKYGQSRIALRSMQNFIAIAQGKFLIEPIDSIFDGFHGNVNHYNLLPRCIDILHECSKLIIANDKYSMIERARNYRHGSS